MTTAQRMLEGLPRPYTAEPSSVIGRMLDTLSLQLEAAEEDAGRVRLAHWVEEAYREVDVVRLAALVGVAPLPWEDARTFRARLLPLVASRIRGGVGPLDITRFTFEYLRAAEDALGRPGDRLPAMLVPGLQRSADETEAFTKTRERPRYRPLALVEHPRRKRQSGALADTAGRVAHLRHWTDSNEGLSSAPVRLTLVGGPAGRTSLPVVVNLTTGLWVGYLGVVPIGRTLVIEAADARSGFAKAWLDGIDVTARLIGGSGWPPVDGPAGTPVDDRPPTEVRIPAMRRGANEWMYLSAGRYGIRGVDRTFFAYADGVMAEAAFDEVSFDRAIFPVGPAATLVLEWVERAPASFEVRVPGGLIVEPGGRPPLAAVVHAALADSIASLRAAGVAASLVVEPFIETQEHRPRMAPSWVSLPAETGPAGTEAGFSTGARFDDTAFGTTRFE